jgi:hypothetical protein
VAKTRTCRNCGKDFEVFGIGDCNRQHCSKQCAKNYNAKTIRTWQQEHPEQMKLYYARRAAKAPDQWRKKWGTERERIIELLGGSCVVCGVTNRHWLHVDYIAGSRGSQYRHPRHFAYVSRHKDEFRLLCANHHYELTLTGAIEGTTITQ